VDTSHWQRDAAAGREFRQQFGIAEDAFLFGLVGRLVPLKCVDLALRAWALLCREHSEPASLCIVGDGPCREGLEELARDLRIADRVHFTGALHDVRPAYSAIDTLLCTSSTESCSLVLGEAMACGCRILAAAVGGTAEVVAHPICGGLLESRSPAAWADAMARHLRTSPADRSEISQGIRAYTLEAHDQRRRFGELENLLIPGAASTRSPR
jgi:glycosyltransferase involved in cell wall biosynthesis